MKRVLTLALAAGLALTMGVPASAAKKPVPPTVTTPSSRTIPWYECHDASEWVHWRNTKTGKGVGMWVTIRKPGYTQRIKGGRICGYMGSGTYNLRIRLDWKKRKKVTVNKPVYRWKTVQKIVDYEWVEAVYEQWKFTCTMTEGIPPKYGNGGYGQAWYVCAYDNGQPWVVPDEAYSGYPVDQAQSELVFYDGNNVALGLYTGAAESGSLPQVLTGSAKVEVQALYARPIYGTQEKRYIHHYRKVRVRKWVEARSFYVNRSISVTVR